MLRTLIRERIKMVAQKKKRVSYTGIVLDNRSKEKLNLFIKEMKKSKRINIPDDWQFSADHVTIDMGQAMDESILGTKVNMKVITFSYDENTIAVGVKLDIELEFEKGTPHITIAYNALGGARPVMSNKLTAWKPVPKSFMISGVVQEVMQEIT